HPRRRPVQTLASELRFPRWVANGLLVISLLLLLWGVLMLTFLGEPSVVGRMHTAVLGIGVVCIAMAIAGGAAGVWMLVARRT
ncbi:MAG TPA: hypothetical protein VKE27_07500, partial [Candidatus Dormibacteraeota bacterium]|nr:hypothetical protein [Candidatus Dormibacteraeota bacterium]